VRQNFGQTVLFPTGKKEVTNGLAAMGHASRTSSGTKINLFKGRGKKNTREGLLYARVTQSEQGISWSNKALLGRKKVRGEGASTGRNCIVRGEGGGDGGVKRTSLGRKWIDHR